MTEEKKGMTPQGIRKLIIALTGMVLLTGVSILSILSFKEDSGAIVAAIASTGSSITAFMGMIMYGYTQEYKKK